MALTSNSNSRRRLLLAALATSATFTTLLTPTASVTAEESFPSRPITLVVPFPPGGPTDVGARMVGKTLSEVLGQSVVVENRAGAGGTVGSTYVARAPADGYTLLWGSTSSLGVAPSLYPNLEYHTLKSFEPVGLVGRAPILLTTRSELPFNNLKEFVDYAKTHDVAYGSAGNGSINHLTGEWLKDVADFKMLHVPYKGGAPALADLLGGRLDLTLETPSPIASHLKAGTVKVLATTGAERLNAMPDVPTVKELYGNDFEVYSWLGIVAPAGTPPAVVKKLNAALRQAQANPELRKQMEAAGLYAMPTTTDEFARFLDNEINKWATLIEKTKPQLD